MRKGLFSILAIMALFACREMENAELPGSSEVTVKGVQMRVPAIEFDAESKSAMTVDESSGISFTWSDGDATGVYSTTGGFARFHLVSGGGMANAVFDGGGFSLTDGASYYAFYPYAWSASNKSAIPLDYSGQSVTSDNDLASPMTKDYLWASAVSDGGNASFSFSHIGAFLRMRITLPEGTNVDKVELMPMYGEVPQTMTFDITSHTPFVSTASPVMSVATSGVTVPSGGKATFWMAMPPQSFSEDFFAVQVYAGSKVYSAEGLIQLIPDTIITPPQSESILKSIESDLLYIEDLLTLPKSEEEPLFEMGNYHYCVPSLWSLYAAIDISRRVNASFSLRPHELAYLMTLIPRKYKAEIKAGRNLAMDEVLSLYIPSVKLGHQYLIDSVEGRCSDCVNQAKCSGTYLTEIEKQLEAINRLRHYDEIRKTCEVMDRICDRSMEQGHVLTGEELWDDLREEARLVEIDARKRLPKIKMWSKVSTFVSIGLGAASFLNPIFGVSAAIPAIAEECLNSYEEKLRKETSWVNFVNYPEAVLNRGA